MISCSRQRPAGHVDTAEAVNPDGSAAAAAAEESMDGKLGCESTMAPGRGNYNKPSHGLPSLSFCSITDTTFCGSSNHGFNDTSMPAVMATALPTAVGTTAAIGADGLSPSTPPWDAPLIFGWISLGWYLFVWAIVCLGCVRIRRSFAKPPPAQPLPSENDAAYVTILRPIKGYDANLELCLTSTCLLEYPRSKFEVLFCVASPTDTAIPVITHIIESHPDVNVRLMIGEEDVGPNPKIRNLSKGYREAAGDIVWIVDCNIWLAPGTLRRSAELLEGTNGHPGYKLVHHLPIVVDVTNTQSYAQDNTLPMSATEGSANPLLRKESHIAGKGWLSSIMAYGGGRLEENFLSSSHAKFYAAINTLGVAPCVVGKSSMFRRSHLDEVTGDKNSHIGLLYFAEHICEDHLIGEKLFVTKLEDEKSGKRKWGKHCLGPDIVYQPVEDMSVRDYLARRTRWIRVRKYSVLAATLLEPFTESFVCSLVGAYGATTVPLASDHFGSSWSSFASAWMISVVLWAAVDRYVFNFFHSYRNTAVDENSPDFISEKRGRKIIEWLPQWLGREFFAFWVSAWALYPGAVAWRGGYYRVRWKDMKVEEIGRDDGGNSMSGNSMRDHDKRRD